MPRVSVIIPCYNLGSYLPEAIGSVLAQSLVETEIVVVDDGSTDRETRQILDTACWSRTTIVRTANRGVSAARNTGISIARGEYILPLDADDMIAPTYLEKASVVLDRETEAGIVYCEAELFGALQGPWRISEFSLPHMLLDNLIFSSALFRRRDWEAVGGYCEQMRIGWEDWDFWLRLLEMGRQAVRLPEPLFAYRIRPGSRERALCLWKRLRLMASLVAGHAGLYLRHAPALARILITGDRRRPERIVLHDATSRQIPFNRP